MVPKIEKCRMIGKIEGLRKMKPLSRIIKSQDERSRSMTSASFFKAAGVKHQRYADGTVQGRVARSTFEGPVSRCSVVYIRNRL